MSRKKRQQPNPQQQSIDSVDDIEGKLQQAISFYQAGQLLQAEQITDTRAIDNTCTRYVLDTSLKLIAGVRNPPL